MDIKRIESLLADAQNAASASQRQIVESLCEEIKRGEPHEAIRTAAAMAAKNMSLEARLFGFSVFQHMAEKRWGEFSPEERRQLVQMAMGILSDVVSASPGECWAVKCKASALLAQMLRQEGPSEWQVVLPQVVQLGLEGPPAQAELAALVFRWMAEDVTVHNHDIQGSRMQVLLKGLLATLPEVLAFFFQILERHFGGALAAAQGGNAELARMHASAVEAGLSALSAYGDWAPVGALSQAGLIQAATHLAASSADFRLMALAFLNQVAGRKRLADDCEGFSAGQRQLGEALLAASQHLHEAGLPDPDNDPDTFEFAKKLVESMSMFASLHLGLLGERGSHFLWQLLSFARQPHLQLAAPPVPAWIALLRETQLLAEGRKSNTGVTLPPDSRLPSGSQLALLQLAGVHMMQLGDKGTVALGPQGNCVPEGFDTAQEFTDFWVMLRSRLLEVIKYASFQEPEAGAQVAADLVRRAVEAVAAQGGGGTVVTPAVLAPVEGAAAFLDAAMGPLADQASRHPGAGATLSSLLQQLLTLHWPEPRLMQQYCRLLDVFGHYVGRVEAGAGPALLLRLFSLLEAAPAQGDPRDPNNKELFNARQRVCSGVLTVAKQAAEALVPHLQQIGECVEQLRGEGHLRVMERGALCEACVLVAAQGGAPPHQTQTVLEWVLAPIRSKWTDPNWTQHFGSPTQFLAKYSQAPSASPLDDGKDCRWDLISDLHMLERTIRRLPPPPSSTPPSSSSSQPDPAASSSSQPPPSSPPTTPTAAASPSVPHPFDGHLAWMLPSLLAVISAVHALWTPQARTCVPPHLQLIYQMSPAERTVLMAVGGTERTLGGGERGASESSAGGGGGEPTTTGEVLRDWIKNLRDSAYQILGLAMSHLPSVFNLGGLAPALHACFLDHPTLQAMEHRHLRAAVRVVLQSLVLHVPLEGGGGGAGGEHQEAWLGPLVDRLLPHMDVRLKAEWQKLEQAGTSADSNTNTSTSSSAPPVTSTSADPTACSSSSTPPGGGSEVSSEVLAERVLRDLSRDYLAVLQLLAAGGHGTGAYAPFRVRGSLKAAANSSGAATGPSTAPSHQTIPSTTTTNPPPPSDPNKSGPVMGTSTQNTGVAAASKVLAEMRPSMLGWLSPSHPSGLRQLGETASCALTWPDSDSAHKGVMACKALVAWVHAGGAGYGVVVEEVGGVMLQRCLQALTLVSNQGHQGELVALTRDILVQVGAHTQTPQKIIQSLPGMTPAIYEMFCAQMGTTRSDKEQRAHVKRLLLQCGGSALKAFAPSLHNGCKVMVKGGGADPSKLLRRNTSNMEGSEPEIEIPSWL